VINFRCSMVDGENNPIISDDNIDKFAEILLNDYKQELLKEPGPINYLHFLESYLGANIEIMDIYYEDNPIWGVTSFNDGERLEVFDRKRKCIKWNKLKKRTIVLDNYVMQKGREGLALFTGLHEAGHLWLHSGVYTRPTGQMSLFGEPKKRKVVCCRKGDIVNFGKGSGYRTAKEWREHHANYFAAAVAMPKSTFVPFVKKMIAVQDFGEDLTSNTFALFFTEYLPKIISDAYGVSKQAAYVRLCKFGFDRLEKKSQLALF